MNHSLCNFSRFSSRVRAKAFRGELTPQDPNAESASALLERAVAEGIHKFASRLTGFSFGSFAGNIQNIGNYYAKLNHAT